MSLLDHLREKRVVIVAGSGGVGKTTTSAALAICLAIEGKRVAVVTIDPAKRLATSLGLDELGNTPQRIDADRFAAHGVVIKGELWAMMLDAKRTFDDLIGRLAPDERTRDEVLGNRIYQELSSAVAGSQEFTAIAKLYELDRDGGFDVVVLDTPPSRNALDFLDAPDRLTGFFEGRALRVFLAPGGLAAKVMGRGTGMVFGVLSRVTGADLLGDLSTFFRALGGLIDGFRERARGVKALLTDRGTAFVLVSSPEPEPRAEAVFFGEKLKAAGMQTSGLIVNRVHRLAEGLSPDDDADLDPALAKRLGPSLARKVADTVSEARVRAARDGAAVADLAAALGQDDPLVIPELDHDVHDVDGLLAICQHITGAAEPAHS